MNRLLAIAFCLVAFLSNSIADPVTLSAGAGARVPPKVKSLLAEAGEHFNNREFASSLILLEDAEALAPDNIETLNLRGAVFAEMGHFDEAFKAFARVVEIEPDHFWARFNLGEIELMQNRPREARHAFVALLEKGENPEFLEFKIALTFLRENDHIGAGNIVEDMKFPSDTAAYYAARAALALHTEDTETAASWLDEGERIFPGGLEGLLLQSLADFGWQVRKSTNPTASH